MTPLQEAQEDASVKAFVADVVQRVRPKGTNAAVTCVILAAAQAAANMATRSKSGAINREEAEKIFNDATRLMTKRK